MRSPAVFLLAVLIALGATGNVEARDPQVQKLLDTMRRCRIEITKLARRVRYPGDHTRRTFLHTRDETYQKSMAFIVEFREAQQSFPKIAMISFLEDYDAVDEFKNLTHWGTSTAIAMIADWKPLDPPTQVERVLHHPGWREDE